MVLEESLCVPPDLSQIVGVLITPVNQFRQIAKVIGHRHIVFPQNRAFLATGGEDFRADDGHPVTPELNHGPIEQVGTGAGDMHIDHALQSPLMKLLLRQHARFQTFRKQFAEDALYPHPSLVLFRVAGIYRDIEPIAD
jgi:hypothetical protein